MVKDTYIILSLLLFPVKFVYFIVSSNLVVKKKIESSSAARVGTPRTNISFIKDSSLMGWDE